MIIKIKSYLNYNNNIDLLLKHLYKQYPFLILQLKTTEINLQPKETEVEEIMPQIMTIVRRIGVKTDINTMINNETKKENPHPPW